MKILLVFLALAGLAIVLVAIVGVRSFRAAPLARPEPWSGPLPEASPPPDLAIFQLPTGTYENRALFAFRGGAFGDKRQFAATAILVHHPEGDLLLDAGFGADVAAHIQTLPAVQRSPHRVQATVREQLDGSGYDFSRLLGVVITHAHWDHVSGLDSLPGPVWMNADELRYVDREKGASVFRTVLGGHTVREYAFDGPAYLGFPSSHDVFGDGSVVIVPAGGHTDGSVVVFVTLPDGARWAFIGDLTWQLEGVTKRAERPAMLQRMADVDPARVRAGLLRVVAWSDRVHVVPAHDVRAYDGIPVWPHRS